MLLADFCLGVVVGPGIAERYLKVRVLHFAIGNNLQVLEYLHVSFVRVEDYVEVLICAEHFGQHVAERLLQHTDHRGLVYIFQFFELGELLDHIRGVLFSCHCFIFILR